MAEDKAPPPPDDTNEAQTEEKKEKKAKKRRGPRSPRGPRKPSFKDWIRVVKSQGNTCPNSTVHLIINEATNIATLVTNAPAKVDDDGNPVGDEMEGERKQIFKITSYEVVNVPDEVPAEATAE